MKGHEKATDARIFSDFTDDFSFIREKSVFICASVAKNMFIKTYLFPLLIFLANKRIVII